MKTQISGIIVSNDDYWVYDYFGIENAYPKKIFTAIEEAKKKNEPLEIFVSSPGGSLSAGVDMYTALRQFGNVRFTVTQACSAASVVICAGYSEISPAGMVMIHNVQGRTEGDHNDAQKLADILKTMDKTVAAAYTDKTGLSEANFLKKMNAETWLTAQQAVELGLCDRILKKADNSGEIPKAAASTGGLLPENVIRKMKDKQAESFMQLELLKLKNHR